MHNVYFNCRAMLCCLLGLRGTSFGFLPSRSREEATLGRMAPGSCGSIEPVSLGTEVDFC